MSEFDVQVGKDIAVIKHKVVDIESHLKELNGSVKENRKRVSKLESWRWFITGGLAILGVMIPVFLVLIQFLFR